MRNSVATVNGKRPACGRFVDAQPDVAVLEIAEVNLLAQRDGMQFLRRDMFG